MFHMLGRFAFTSSFSRRSSSGLSTGETRFGSCFCENGLLSIFIISYQSIHYSQFEALRWLLPRSIAAPIRVPFPRECFASLIWVRHRPNHMLSERGDFGRLPRVRNVAIPV